MKKGKKIIISLLVAVFFVSFFWVQNNWLTVTYYSFENEKVPQELEGCRLVQISDLHNKEFGKNNQRLMNKITQLEPDMILLTGDLIDSNHTDIEAALTFAKQAVKISPTYYVTGNHENWLSPQDKTKLLNNLKNLGVICLENQVAEVEINHSALSVIGLNDENLSDNTLTYLVSDLEKDSPIIVLAHEPQYFEHYCDSNGDLVLSGHAHGGQFRLPFLGGVVAPDQGILPEYTQGEHTQGNTTMIISRGLGNSIIPLRLFNLPEIVCIDLK